MIDLSNYREYLSERASEILSLAIDESKKRQHYYLGTEHVFLAFIQIEKDFFHAIMGDLRLEPDLIVRFLEEHLTVSKQYLGVGLKIPPSTKNAFKQAWEAAQHAGRKVIEPVDLLTAIFQDTEGVPVKIFKSLGIEPEVISHMIQIKARTKEKETEEMKKRFELPPHLKYFGVNLNKLARTGKLPQIF